MRRNVREKEKGRGEKYGAKTAGEMDERVRKRRERMEKREK
jgi:hypothetical protein